MMRNPLNKRLPREFFGEFGKYAAIFLFMAATISFVSGFLVASGSMQLTYDESFERYNVEDGHFVLSGKADEKLTDKIEKEDVTLYEDFYLELDTDINLDDETDSTLRIFAEREEVNRVCLLDGEMPEETDEIAIDRMYADNNDIEIGDTMRISGKELKVCGLVALPDYSTMYQDNNDMMFDSKLFGVAVVTGEAFEEFGTGHIHYSYAWKYDEKPEDDAEEKEVSEELAETIAVEAMKDNMEIDIFLPGFMNRAIHFTGDDIGSDRPMMTVLLYILIVIMAFVFAVTINHTVAREAAVIGTLRASGYTKGEIFRHYLATPMLVTFLAAILGNIAGYTIFEDVARDMYLGSYSLTTYVSRWNAEAFIMTTVVPMVIMLAVTSISLWKKLSLSPLQFIRRDIAKKKREKAVKLPHFKFFTRFRIRIILQNISGYLTLFVGIVFANLILMFGMIMTPLLDNYGKDAVKYKPADYQYVISSACDVPEDVAEPYCVTSLRMQDDYYDEEDISIYGLVEDSEYYDCELLENGVVITSDMAAKYELEEGDIVNLKEKYGNHIYAFEVSEIFEYPTCLGIYMSMEDFNETFEKEDGYYNGYFSDQKLEGRYLEEDSITSCITEEDLTKLSRQMDISMGSMFGMVNVFAIVLFALLIYLLTKLILEKNTTSISMVKILGYENGEIGSLYLVSSVWVVVISAVLSLFINTWIFQYILKVFMKGYGGWFNLEISTQLYLEMFLMMVGTYLVVAFIQLFKIKRIPMDEALKNVE